MTIPTDCSNEFEDPLENYDPPTFDDPVEEALSEQLVSSLAIHPYTCVTADTSVRDTMKLMAGRQINCVLVEDNERLVGVFGDRDVLNKVALEYSDVMDRPVREIMSTDPVSVKECDPVAKVISIIAISGYRHVPVVDPEGRPVGIVSPQRIEHFLCSQMET